MVGAPFGGEKRVGERVSENGREKGACNGRVGCSL